MKKYIAVINPKDFGIIFPDFLGCVSVGEDLDDAIKMAKEALEFHIQGIQEDNQELPEPKKFKEIKKEYPNQFYFIIEIC